MSLAETKKSCVDAQVRCAPLLLLLAFTLGAAIATMTSTVKAMPSSRLDNWSKLLQLTLQL